MAIHLGRPLPTGSSNRPGRSPRGTRGGLKASSSLFGFAPGGVYHAAAVASSAVRSYRTLSLLPIASRFALLRSAMKRAQGRVALLRSFLCPYRKPALCGTFPRIAPGGCYPPPCFVEPGLSSGTKSRSHDRTKSHNIHVFLTSWLRIQQPSDPLNLEYIRSNARALQAGIGTRHPRRHPPARAGNGAERQGPPARC